MIKALVIIVCAAAFAYFAFFNFDKAFAPETTQDTACTLEAKICSDGSAVGRTGPNCTFAPCPN